VFARACTPNAHELGRLGEEHAVRTHHRAGLVSEGRRVRTTHAEVDVLAVDVAARTLVVVEVKTARFEPVPGPRGTPPDLARRRFVDAGRLGAAQAMRLLRAAESLGRQRRIRTRVDLVEVWLSTRPRAVIVEHRADVGKSFPAVGGSRSHGAPG
jgi:hypothetical protein